MSKSKIVFCHGFLFDQSFFDNIKRLFDDKFDIIDVDLGYNGLPIIPSADICNGAIAIGHDIGLLKLIELGYSFKKYIGISSFISYNDNVASNRFLLNFEYSFNKDPIETIFSHINRLGLYEIGIKKNINLSNVKQSLIDLKTLDIEKIIPSSEIKKKVIFLNGAKDIFYSANAIQNYKNKYNIIINDIAGYELGYDHIDWCFDNIIKQI